MKSRKPLTINLVNINSIIPPLLHAILGNPLAENPAVD